MTSCLPTWAVVGLVVSCQSNKNGTVILMSLPCTFFYSQKGRVTSGETMWSNPHTSRQYWKRVHFHPLFASLSSPTDTSNSSFLGFHIALTNTILGQQALSQFHTKWIGKKLTSDLAAANNGTYRRYWMGMTPAFQRAIFSNAWMGRRKW
jgi:hypothetical protein